MNTQPYKHLVNEQIDFRDYLALERTALSNERTLLAYVRTMIGLIALGGTLVKFFEGVFIGVVGWSFILFGVVTVMFGFIRYIRMAIFLNYIDTSKIRHIFHNDKIHKLFWSLLHKVHLS